LPPYLARLILIYLEMFGPKLALRKNRDFARKAEYTVDTCSVPG
jgi:hypothetical protein